VVIWMAREAGPDWALRDVEFPAAFGDWSLSRITAGVWLSAAAMTAPPDVRALPAEPGRFSVVVDAAGPGPRTDQLLDQLIPVLTWAGLGALRLVLPAGADRYAAAAARGYGLDLIAAEAAITITPHGYALVRSAEPAISGALAQWRRCLPGGGRSAAGVLAPSPAWERGLAASLAVDLGHGATVRRVPAGLALSLPALDAGGPAAEFDRAAHAVWPDPERLCVVVNPAGPVQMLHDCLTTLLLWLPTGDTDGVRLCWPRAGVGAAGLAVQELARRCGADLIAPTADISDSGGCGGICHGPMGAAPWLRFTHEGDVQVMGALYPEPAWERALAEADLGTAADGLIVEHVAAGLSVYRPGPSARGLATTARSIIPDPARATIIVGVDLPAGDARREAENVLSSLPVAAARRLRVVLAGAGHMGPDSFGQFLADRFGSQVVVPLGEWTATPDGRLRASTAGGAAGGAAAPGPAADGWCEFWPRRQQHPVSSDEGGSAVLDEWRRPG
jgi:hypothetical protein